MNSQLFFLHSVLIPLLKAAKMGLIELFFADGVHLIYGYHGGYCWCKERQCVPSAYGRERVNLLGFMNAITFETTKKMNDSYLDSDSVCDGLDELRKKYPEKILYIILDNAAYQRCEKVSKKAKQLNGLGRGQAVAGIIVSIVSMVLSLVLYMYLLSLYGTEGAIS